MTLSQAVSSIAAILGARAETLRRQRLSGKRQSTREKRRVLNYQIPIEQERR